jgi:hypothetical protein
MTRLSIRYGYPWENNSPCEDAKYFFLKHIAESGAAAIESMIGPNNERVEVVCSRLRGQHGCLILSNIRTRIQSADVLLLDLDGYNANVMLELGMALSNSENGQFIFLLLKEGQSIPSDLSGYLISFYQETEDYALVDANGFHAALRSALVKRAQFKGIALKWKSKNAPWQND